MLKVNTHREVELHEQEIQGHAEDNNCKFNYIIFLGPYNQPVIIK